MCSEKVDRKGEEESGTALRTVELIRGGWLVLKVDDELIRDANFPDGILASKLAESERLQYNLSHSCFGYGSDVMDWENADDEWIEFEEMDVEKEGKCVLYFSEGYFLCSWTWQDGSVEGVVAKISDGHVIDVYSLADEEWRDAGDQNEMPEDSTVIYASFKEALENAIEQNNNQRGE